MNTLILVACFAAVAFAAPTEHVEPAPFELKHHADVDGSYTYTYASEDSSKTETRVPSGSTRGAYSYIDDNGILQKVQYIADENGFQVYGTNLPVGSTVPVKETPEVLEATAQHFALVDKHLNKLALAEKSAAAFRAAHPEYVEQHEVHHVFAPVEHIHVPVHHIEVPQQHHFVEVAQHVQFVDDVPVAPQDDEDVQIARAQHLAEVERITAEHYAALAAAPRFEER